MDNVQFSSIRMTSPNFEDYIFESDRQKLDNLSQINIFIGKNSSGKSRLLRRIFAEEDLQFLSPIFRLKSLRELFAQFAGKFNLLTDHNKSFQPENESIKQIKLEPWLSKTVDFRPVIVLLKQLKKRMNELKESVDPTVKKCSELVDEYYPKVLAYFPGRHDDLHDFKYENIYIPMLRGLRPTHSNNSQPGVFDNSYDSYLFRTTHDYFSSRKAELNDRIYTGLNLYKDLKNHSHGYQHTRQMVKDFQTFLSETFFNNEDVELIPNVSSDVVYVKIGNYEHPIHDLGDGIQALIILTYPLFFNKDKNLKVYIEEPETFLHPGFQRLFLETLKKPEFKNFQYFLTTHSNHFLDLTLDLSSISVFTFEKVSDLSGTKNPRFRVLNVENSNTSILSLIGVRNSSVFLSNCTIWVEGISDRIYMRKYLELIQMSKKVKYKEDTHFSFVEYGGNNITHWSFLSNENENVTPILVERLCGRLFLITDNDNASNKEKGTSSKKFSRQEKLSKKLGKRYYCLKCLEVENLLTPEILKSLITRFEKGNIGKQEILNFEHADYKLRYLGEFINETIKGKRRNYATDSGTITNKVNFAKQAVELIKKKTDMSKEAISLAEKLYKFIKGNNL